MKTMDLKTKVGFLIKGLQLELSNGEIKVGHYSPDKEWLAALEEIRSEILAELSHREAEWNQAGRPKYFILDLETALLVLGKYRWRPKRGGMTEVSVDEDGTPVINYTIGVPKMRPWDLWTKNHSIVCQVPGGHENHIPRPEVVAAFDDMRQKGENYRVVQLRRYHPSAHVVSMGGHHE